MFVGLQCRRQWIALMMMLCVAGASWGMFCVHAGQDHHHTFAAQHHPMQQDTMMCHDCIHCATHLQLMVHEPFQIARASITFIVPWHLHELWHSQRTAPPYRPPMVMFL